MKIKIIPIVAMATLFVGQNLMALGFGVDNLFDSVTQSNVLLAESNCPQLNIDSGSQLVLIAHAEEFRIVTFDSNKQIKLNIAIPSEGNYVYQGESPNRSSHELVSPILSAKVTNLNSKSGILIESHTSQGSQSCFFTRCANFGPCIPAR